MVSHSYRGELVISPPKQLVPEAYTLSLIAYIFSDKTLSAYEMEYSSLTLRSL